MTGAKIFLFVVFIRSVLAVRDYCTDLTAMGPVMKKCIDRHVTSEQIGKHHHEPDFVCCFTLVQNECIEEFALSCGYPKEEIKYIDVASTCRPKNEYNVAECRSSRTHSITLFAAVVVVAAILFFV